MTVTIDIPSTAEKPLQSEASRVGLSVGDLIAQIVAERFREADKEDSLARLVKSISGVAPPNVDVSREGIYADL